MYTNLTGSDLKVLYYLSDVYAKLMEKKYPGLKTVDGWPVITTIKDVLCDKCGVSVVTLRKSLRKLAESKVVALIPNCLGHITGVAVNSEVLKCVPSMTESNDFVCMELLQEIACVTNQMKITRVPIILTRVPIVLTRTPIILTRVPIVFSYKKDKMLWKSKFKLENNQDNIIDSKVSSVAEYYSFLARKRIKSTGYRALPLKNIRSHKNWIHFFRVYKLCQNKGWDYKLYLEAQFDRVRHWSHKTKIPFPNQLWGEGAVNYYLSYTKERTQLFMELQTGGKAKAEERVTVKQEVIEAICTDCERIKQYLNRMKVQTKNCEVSDFELKKNYITVLGASLSVYYIAATTELAEKIYTEEMNEDIKEIRKNKTLLKLVKEIIEKAEEEYGIPA